MTKENMLYMNLYINSRERATSATLLSSFGQRLAACEFAHLSLEIAIKAVLAKYEVDIVKTHSISILVSSLESGLAEGRVPKRYESIKNTLSSTFNAFSYQYWTPDFRYTKVKFSDRDYKVLMQAKKLAERILKEVGNVNHS